jgi:isoleucyl-tRNA synthetase/phosphohistidine phosphatase SixA/N-acetylglutamate synthase-like GNAT family acetyltransferase
MTTPFFPPHDPKASVPNDELKTLQFWKEDRTFERTLENRSEKFPYKFFDGPPFATGTPHYGHILAGTIKDAIPRYWTMKGYRVDRKWGWDCHGVPVEFQVEKENNIGGKPGIEKMGVAKFNELCRSVVLRCAEQWKTTVARMGRFVDFENDYKTMDPEFMESVWWVFGELYNKGLIYEGEKVIAYSPKLGSPLSNFEANLNYCDIDDPAVTVRFKVLDGSENDYFLAWTTTPWTLPSNVALGFGRETEYSLVETEKANYWVASKLVEKQFGEDAKILKTEIGKNMAGMKYQPLFHFFTDLKPEQKRFVTLHDAGDYISTDSGTGIVHFAPSFGLEDSELCDKWEISGVNPIDENGYFDFTDLETFALEKTPELQGKYFRADPEVNGSKENNANDWVIEKLKESGDLFKRDQIRHSYPHCWRTDCALMYRGIKTWFVNVKKIKQTMLDQNQKINWLPDHLKDGRFGKLLESAPDWAISRNRYWGCPIPAWKCDITGKVQVITSRKELEDLTGKEVDDIHKHFVDDLTWQSPFDTNGTMIRVPEVLDCWFESGSMPYGSIHYPFSKTEEKNLDPAKNVSEQEMITLRNKFWIIRHGESENNVQEIYNCSLAETQKFGLTEAGKKQVEKNSDSTLTEPIDLVIASPFRRCRETAEIIAKKHGQTVIIDEALKEIDLGDFDGQAHRCFAGDNPFLPTGLTGESLAECQERMIIILKKLNQKYQGKNIVLVSHGGPIAALLQWINRETLEWPGRSKGTRGIPKNGVPKALMPFDPKKAKNIHEAKTTKQKQSVKAFITKTWKEEFNLETVKCSKSTIFYIEQDEKIIGAIDFCERRPGVWKICHLVIQEEKRNQKFGSELFAVALEYAKDHQAKQIFLKAEASMTPFYEKFGLQKISSVKRYAKNPAIEYFDMMISFDSEETPTDYFQPADFIAEGLDQTRGWFYTLHVLGCALFGKRIFKNVITNGIVLAEDGQKMSKSKKNYPDPNIVFDKYGADAMRFYLLSSPVVRGENFRFTERGVEEVLKSVILPLKSSYNFLSTYATIDQWKPTTFQFLRHGEGEHNARGIYSGQADNAHSLTEKGRQQVTDTAQNLNACDIIISSPFVRTRETAEIAQSVLKSKFGEKIPTEVLFDERIQEPFFGELEGKKLIPTFKRLANKTTEKINSIQARVTDFVEDISQKHRGKNILVASHGSPIRHAECLSTQIHTISDAVRLPYLTTGTARTIFAEPITSNEIDTWILSELQTLIGQYHVYFESYDLEAALRHFAPFIDKLNNWYLRRSRRRFWANGLDDDKRSGYETLHHVLFTLSKLLAPICPFFAEKLFQDLGGPGSVHLEYLPYADDKKIDSTLEEKIRSVREIVGLAAGIRARAKIKLRQPLAKLQFLVSADTELDLEVIKAEANVKEVEILTDAQLATFAQKIIRVNARKVGKKFGKKVQELIKAGKAGEFEILDTDQVKIAGELLEADEYEVGFITAEGVEAEATPTAVVLLDTVITETLKIEGYSREIIRAIQDLRKKSGFDIADRIVVSYHTDSDTIKQAFTQCGASIESEVLAETIQVGTAGEAIMIDGESATLEIQKYSA